MDFDDLLVRTVNALELYRGGARALAPHLPPRPRRRVPGHQPRPVPAAAAARLRARQPDGGRRRGPVDLRVPPRRPPQHPRLRPRLPRSRAGQARAELPLDRDDPCRRQRGRRAQPRAAAEGAVDRSRRGGEDPALRARRRARGGALGRGRDRAPRRGARGRPGRGRGLLPDQRDEPRGRGHAQPLQRPLPGDRRHQVLRAGRGQGRARLPQPAAEPRRPGLLRAGRQLAPARDRQHQPGPPRRLRQHRRADDLGGDGTVRGGAGTGRGGDPVRRPLPRDDGPAARAGRRRRAGRRAAAGGAERDRLPGGARSRAHGRGRRQDREPRSAGRGRRRVRPRARAGGRGRGAAAGGVPAADLAALRPGLARGRARAGDADDAAQRQGARVRHGLRRRLRGRRLPPHAGPGGGRRRRGAPPLLRRDHPRPPAPLSHLGPRATALRPRRAQPALALHRRAARSS